MKKSFLLLPVLLCCLFAKAQNPNDSLRNTYKKEFLINPFSLFVGGFEVGYGVFDSKMRLARLYAGYYFQERPIAYDDREDVINGVSQVVYRNMEGVRLEAQYLFYKPTDAGLRLFMGGYGNFKTISMDVKKTTTGGTAVVITNYRAKGTAVGLGILFGIRSYLIDNFFFDLYAGGGINLSLDHRYEEDVNINVVNPYKKAIVPKGGFSFGLAF